jgi:hypothetical protein
LISVKLEYSADTRYSINKSGGGKFLESLHRPVEIVFRARDTSSTERTPKPSKSKQEREKNIISEKDMPDMTEKQQITSKESTRPLRSVSNMQNKEETYSSIANLEISSSNLRCPVICLRS